MLPPEVLERAREGLINFNSSGMSVMEISHRSDAFLAVLRSAEQRLRSLLYIPGNYRVFFLQGGASMQFSMVPMNFLTSGGAADYVVTGTWGAKAFKRASEIGAAKVINVRSDDGFTTVPLQEELGFSADARYVHYVSNETIDGVEFRYDLDGFGVPVVCDASSNILSRQIDIDKYSLIYAGAQKNIGPSGVTVVIIRDDFLETAHRGQGVLNYRSFAGNDSMPNTPNTWGVYMIDLVCEWLQNEGGVEAIEKRNAAKADLLYSAIDNSDGFYSGTAEPAARSRMNVTFRLQSEEKEAEFCVAAEKAGLVGLRGHRSVGGIRASIYNAFPVEGVEKLINYMDEFAQTNR